MSPLVHEVGPERLLERCQFVRDLLDHSGHHQVSAVLEHHRVQLLLVDRHVRGLQS